MKVIMNYKKTLDIISKQYTEQLKENLTGIYIHGSLAFNCFNPHRSDIDFIVVVENPISQQAKLSLLKILEELRERAPRKGFEMSIVLKRHCLKFEYPTPYELHFSNHWLERYLKAPLSLCNDDIQTDYDLAAHFTVIRHVGLVLCGSPVPEVFGSVPKEHYWDSICRDIRTAEEDVFEDPVYVILNLCRVYAYKKDGLILSKEQGGQWGLKNLPVQYNGILKAALDDYSLNIPFKADDIIKTDLCRYMTEQIFRTKL